MPGEYSKAKKEMREWLLDQYIPHDGITRSYNIYSTENLILDEFKEKFSREWIALVISELNEESDYWHLKRGLNNFVQSIPISRDAVKESTIEVKNNFLAIDFETANRYRNSACAVGLVRVSSNRITHFESYLIKPPTDYFEFTYLHGISYKDVQHAPTFKELWMDIAHHFYDIDFAVAHNASFDRTVLDLCCNYYGINHTRVNFECTMKLSRKLWNIRPTKLSDVSKHFNIPLDHHQAASDTLACAKIMLLGLNDGNKSFDVNSVYVPPLKTNKLN